ncbi:DNA mismatch repair protein MutS [Clostridium fermenticellae]|uniref:DNA mismatch repair protein MutS n=1 Tax=Clostridium fermenticellae TaxID=2068654 RepID=A0A386H3K3_9CLOT|nr:DNA mismatch repair protein MutS [Clostridium fermenticellae]AYD40297.1 DNA mismatch repair protein MutS [Clostridium fermenticellae]
MGLTPMLQQYLDVKKSCKDCILFFRVGDFYEMFFDDAELASRELELVLTGKDCGLEKRAPMCGVPFHAANSYIGRLVGKGYKVAICEQLEDPDSAKGLVKRGIIKIITPGTYTDSSFLEENKNNYIMSIYIDNIKNSFSLCCSDISTGEFNCTDSILDLSIILDEIAKYSPTEILIQEHLDLNIYKAIKERFNVSFTKLEDHLFTDDACKNLEIQFKGFDHSNFNDILLKSCNGLLKYIKHTQKTSLSNINKLQYYTIVDYMTIDMSSRRNLELTETLRDKTKKDSFLWVLDKTSTAMGGRQLKKWIEQPLINEKSINNRLDAVEEIINNISYHEDLKEALKEIYDIERLTGKVSSKSVTAKELIWLKTSLEKVPCIKKILSNFKSNLLNNMYKNLDELKDIYELLDNSILDNPSISLKEGNLIKEGFNSKIDDLRKAKAHGKEWIANLESSEKNETGIKSLKISYNKVFGYYIEVTKSNLNLVPEGRYIRKQTLTNAERYITPELKDMEDKILGAEEKLINLEYDIFVNIRDTVEEQVGRMQETAKIISELDCLNSLAYVALENDYCKPKINNKCEIHIVDGRHPVVEKSLDTGTFVANDTNLNVDDDKLLLITGPNMAGKSTYMRQVALIVIMAQIGSFVPAKKANICICDKIFTRIGASDDLAAGKSTFMVEMWEVSNILKNATRRSLVLLDEVGRGTSTYDGLSIAWAIIEYICGSSNLGCKTLFATHYHELTKLEGIIDGVKNYSVSVKENGNDITFLRKIIRGGADQSYGIEVAKLAGLPYEVINRAKEILSNIENSNKDNINVKEITDCSIEESVYNEDFKVEEKKNTHEHEAENIHEKQVNFFDIQKDNLIEDILSIDILNMTPMEGFNKLYDIIKKTKEL